MVLQRFISRWLLLQRTASASGALQRTSAEQGAEDKKRWSQHFALPLRIEFA